MGPWEDRVAVRRGSLSRRRPLAWAAFLPVALVGLLLGAESPSVFGSAAAFVPAVLLGVTPWFLLRHRRLGTVVGLLGACALVPQGARDDDGRPEASSLQPASPVAVVEGFVTSVRPAFGWGDATGVSLEVEIARAPEDPGGGPASGERIRLTVGDARRRWEIGDPVRARLALRPARGFCNDGIDRWARSLRRRGVRWTAWARDDRAIAGPGTLDGGIAAWVSRLRGAIGGAIDGAVGDPAAAVLRALVIGDAGRVPEELREAFSATGTAHLLAVSGLHLGLVAAASFAVGRWALVALAPRTAVARPMATVTGPFALACAAAYAALTGFAVSTRRALVMTALVVAAGVGRRRGEPLAALAATVALLVAFDPAILREVSFQLSVAAVTGLLLWERRAPGGAAGRRSDVGRTGGFASLMGEWLRRGAGATFAASVATAPITAYVFGTVPLLGLVANLLVGPVLGGPALGGGLLGALLLPGCPSVAALVFRAAGTGVDLSIGIVQAIASWPAATLRLAPPAPSTAWVAGSGAAAFLLPRGTLRRVAAGLFGLGIATLAVVGGRSPEFRLTLLDVGQGDAVVLESGDRAWLVDGGGLGGSYDTGAGVVLPALARRAPARLLAVVLSHADRDHYGGLQAVIERADPGPEEFWWNGRGSDARAFRELRRAISDRGLPERRLRAGGVRSSADVGLELRVLHPTARGERWSANDASLVLAATYGATRVLLTGDVEARGERSMLAPGGAFATIVKVPHHGSRTSSSREFVDGVRPALALASLGFFNRYGFPAREVVHRYRERGARWRTTGRSGEIVVESDGQVETVATCRSGGAA